MRGHFLGERVRVSDESGEQIGTIVEINDREGTAIVEGKDATWLANERDLAPVTLSDRD